MGRSRRRPVPSGAAAPGAFREGICPACGATVPGEVAVCPACAAPVLLVDRYRLLQLLGQGGQGRTFLARDERTGEDVAIKELSLAWARDWKSVELFERAATVLANLDHRSIPRVLGRFQVERGGILFSYLVQERIDGESLSARLERVRQAAGGRPAGLTEQEVLLLARRVLKVLVHLHGQTPPLIHRDIKPSNIMVRPAGQVVLIDFGLVRELHRPGGGSTVALGTPGYAPLEQYVGQASPATDLYALGATLVALLTGREPVELMPPGEHRIVWRSCCTVSPEFGQLLDRLLEPDPHRRCGSAREALGLLRKAAGRLSHQGPSPEGERAEEPALASGTRAPPLFSWLREKGQDTTFAPSDLFDLPDHLGAALLALCGGGLAGLGAGAFGNPGRMMQLLGGVWSRPFSVLVGLTLAALALGLLALRREEPGPRALTPAALLSGGLGLAVAAAGLPLPDTEQAIRSAGVLLAGTLGLLGVGAAVAWEEDPGPLPFAAVPFALVLGLWLLVPGPVPSRSPPPEQSGAVVGVEGGPGHRPVQEQVPVPARPEPVPPPTAVEPAPRGPTIVAMVGHTSPVRSLSVSANGRWAVSTGNVALLWDLRDKRVSSVMDATVRGSSTRSDLPSALFLAAAISPDGQRIALGDSVGRIHVVDERGGTPRLLDGLNDARLLQFYPSGQHLLVGRSDRRLEVWDLESGVRLHEAPTGEDVGSLVLLRDGQRALLGARNLQLWAVDPAAPPRLLRSFPAGRYQDGLGRFSPVQTLTLFEDEERVLASTFHGEVVSLSLRDGERSVLFAEGSALRLAQSLDLRRFVSVDAWGELTVRGGSVGEVLTAVGRHEGGLGALALLPDRRSVLAGGQDGSLALWDLEQQSRELLHPGFTSGIRAVAWSPGGRLLAASSGRLVRIWQTEGLTLRDTLDDHAREVVALRFRGDRQLVSAGKDDRVLLWDLSTPGQGHVLQELPGHAPAGRQDGVAPEVTALDLSPDGRLLLTGGLPVPVQLIDLDTGRSLPVPSFSRPVPQPHGVAFSPDGQQAAAYDLRELLVWTPGSAEPVLRQERDKVIGVAFPADTRFLWLARYQEPLLLLEPVTGRTVARAESHWSAQSLSVGWSGRAGAEVPPATPGSSSAEPNCARSTEVGPDTCAGWYAALGTLNHAVALIDLYTGERRQLLTGHRDDVLGVAISPEGGRIASGSQDGTVRIWYREQGRSEVLLAVGEEWITWDDREGCVKARSPGGLELVRLLLQEQADREPRSELTWCGGDGAARAAGAAAGADPH